MKFQIESVKIRAKGLSISYSSNFPDDYYWLPGEFYFVSEDGGLTFFLKKK